MKNDVEFKYAGGGFDLSYEPYKSSFGRAFRQEIRINCFSSGSKTFVKAPDISLELFIAHSFLIINNKMT